MAVLYPSYLSEILRVAPSRANCFTDKTRTALSSLTHMDQAKTGDLVGVVRNITTDTLLRTVPDDTDYSSFYLFGSNGDFNEVDEDALDPVLLRFADPIYSAACTDPQLNSWIYDRIKERHANAVSAAKLTGSGATFEELEVICLPDAAIMMGFNNGDWSESQTPRGATEWMVSQIEVVFPVDIGSDALLNAKHSVEAVLSNTVYSYVGQEYGFSPVETRVRVGPL